MLSDMYGSGPGKTASQTNDAAKTALNGRNNQTSHHTDRASSNQRARGTDLQQQQI